MAEQSRALPRSAGHFELVKGWGFVLGPPKPGAHTDQVLGQDAAVVRAVAHKNIRVRAGLVCAIPKITAGSHFDVNQSARHGRDVCHRGSHVGVGQILEHALTDDQIVLLAVTPAGDVAVEPAVLLAHGQADFGSRVGDGLVVLLEPVFPQADASADIEDALEIQAIPAREANHERGEVRVFFRANNAGLRGFVEAVVVRFVEATKPIHDLQSNSKVPGDSDAFAECSPLSGWSHGLYRYESMEYY